MTKDQLSQIVFELEMGTISFEEAFTQLSMMGICPALLNDDNGHWAVTLFLTNTGMQSVCMDPEPCDVECIHYVEAHQWKKTIKDALIYELLKKERIKNGEEEE